MADVWSSVRDLSAAVQQRLAEVLETRGADPRQQAMRRDFLASVDFPVNATVVEIGCGSGVLTRVLARWPNVATVTGVDPAPSLLARARDLAGDLPNLRFQEGDGRALPFADAAFDVAVFDSTLCHVPEPDRALAEAFRVLRPDGWLAVFDGDYATTTVALSDHDPLQTCAAAMMASSVHDRWLARRLPTLVAAAGFTPGPLQSHGYAEAPAGGYLLTVIDRGADLLHARGEIGEDLATALKAEARRRVEVGSFFGHIAYASLVARKSV